MTRVAIIDIGSNSIKLLVASRLAGHAVNVIATESIEARISAGISRDQPTLAEAGMERGLTAIQELLAEAAAHRPNRTLLVATSAVRDALNGREFARRVHAATGHEVRILTGEEEATLIGRGLTTDGNLTAEQDFYVFDLGGGSLECLAFRARKIERAVSFPLGCVRMTERFVVDPSAPVPADALAEVAAHTRRTIAAGFAFGLPARSATIATGGTVATLRRIFARRAGLELATAPMKVTVAEARSLPSDLAALPLSQRR
jgi:exopolyphosphatase/guanosine-5'-triphosphate,3'-diphosphate pyrophosphatase